MFKNSLAGLVLALAFPVIAQAEVEALNWADVTPEAWDQCDQSCAIDTITGAKSVVIFHTNGQLQKDEAVALVAAVRRGLRVSVFVGEENNLSNEVINFTKDIYQKWAVTADDHDTSMLGMGGCVLGATDTPSFIVVDPFNLKAGESAAFVTQGRITADAEIAARASVIPETEDFIQCQLN